MHAGNGALARLGHMLALRLLLTSLVHHSMTFSLSWSTLLTLLSPSPFSEATMVKELRPEEADHLGNLEALYY